MIQNIKAVCFDFGGVIELYEDGDIMAKIGKLLNIPLADFKSEYFKNNHLSNVNNQNWEDVVIKTISVFNVSNEKEIEARSLIHRWYSSKKLNTELLSWFPILKQKGFKIGILSNATTKRKEDLETKEIYDLVDAAIISADIGFQKPHKEAFDVLFQKLNVLPEETIFIDDAQRSLEKAREIGYHPILFKDNDQLKKDLQNFGIYL